MTEEDWRRLVQGLIDGNQVIVKEFFDRYGPRIKGIAAKRLKGLGRRVDPDDVVQSVCRTFLRRARDGRIELRDSDRLWALLCAITLNKIRKLHRFHNAQMRQIGRAVQLSPVPADETAACFEPTARDMSPSDTAEFAEQFGQFVASLDHEEKEVVDWKLQGKANSEIARLLHRSERTVRRIFQQLEERFRQAFEVN